VAIAGIAESRYTKWGKITDRSEFQLALEVIVRAVEDAGLALDEVDGLSSFSNDRNDGLLVATALGLPELRYADMTWIMGGGGACAAVGNAAMAVATGVARCVVVYRSICMGEFQRFGRPLVSESVRPLDRELGFALPFGLFNATIGMAMLVRRPMHLYGTTTRQLGAVAVACRAHANRNPAAVMHGRPMTLEDHARSPLVAEPFRLFDCCLETDGGCALVLVSAERARDLRRRPVYVRAAAQGMGRRYGIGAWSMQYMPEDDYAPAARAPWRGICTRWPASAPGTSMWRSSTTTTPAW
jgi:acetyl-CoA acetyltransferase